MHARLGDELLQRRRASGMTQAGLARQVGCSVPTVRLAEAGGGKLLGFTRLASHLGTVLDGVGLPGGDGVGRSLGLLRRRRGISGRELSCMASVCKQTLADLEAGRDCRLANVVQIARKLGIVLRLRDHGPQGFYSGVAKASVHDLWTTPASLLEQLYPLVGGRFTLDPCSPTRIPVKAPVRARAYYTVEDDGLALAWDGDVFMNPPYGANIGDWVAKAWREVVEGNACAVVGLIPARTDTGWWHGTVAPAAHAWLLRSRLRFGSTCGGAAPFASAVVLWGGDEALRAGLHAAFPPGKAHYVRPARETHPCTP